MNSKKLLLTLSLTLAAASSASAVAILNTTPIEIRFADIGGSSVSLNLDGGPDEFVFTRIDDSGSKFIEFNILNYATTKIVKGTDPFDNFGQFTNVPFASLVNNTANLQSSAFAANISEQTTGIEVPTIKGFTLDTPGYIAFSFVGQSGSSQFGWAQLTFSSTGITIGSYGYETQALTALNVGDGTPVPEPSSYALAFSVLALGLVGARRIRRK